MNIIKSFLLITILGLATYIGNLISKKYINRVNELKCIKLALNTLKSKIQFAQMPLKEIFIQLKDNCKEKSIKNIFTKAINNLNQNLNVTESWQKAIKSAETNLNEEDLNLLADMAKMLGKTDIDGQVSNIEITSNFIDCQIQKAEIEKQKNTKLFSTLGIVIGMAIIIILI